MITVNFEGSTENWAPSLNIIIIIIIEVSFAILRSTLLCLRGSRTPKRTIRSNVQEADFELDVLPKSRSYKSYTHILI